jgi:hypothetical protein
VTRISHTLLCVASQRDTLEFQLSEPLWVTANVSDDFIFSTTTKIRVNFDERNLSGNTMKDFRWVIIILLCVKPVLLSENNTFIS